MIDDDRDRVGKEQAATTAKTNAHKLGWFSVIHYGRLKQRTDLSNSPRTMRGHPILRLHETDSRKLWLKKGVGKEPYMGVEEDRAESQRLFRPGVFLEEVSLTRD